MRQQDDGALRRELGSDGRSVDIDLIDPGRQDESHLGCRSVLELTVCGVVVVVAVVVEHVHQRAFSVDLVIAEGGTEDDTGLVLGESSIVLAFEVEDRRSFLEWDAGTQRVLRFEGVSTGVPCHQVVVVSSP